MLTCFLLAGLVAKIAVAFHPPTARYRMSMWRRYVYKKVHYMLLCKYICIKTSNICGDFIQMCEYKKIQYVHVLVCI